MIDKEIAKVGIAVKGHKDVENKFIIHEIVTLTHVLLSVIISLISIKGYELWFPDVE